MAMTEKAIGANHVDELQKNLAFSKRMRLDLQKFMIELKQKRKNDEISNPVFIAEWTQLFESFTKLSRVIVSISDEVRKIESALSLSDNDLDKEIAELGYVLLSEMTEADLLEELRRRGNLLVPQKPKKKSTKINLMKNKDTGDDKN